MTRDKQRHDSFKLTARWLTAALILSFIFLLPGRGKALAAGNEKALNMVLGEVRVLKIGDIERVAIGNPKVASNTILPNGQLVILADSIGFTTIHI